uniref:Uncharacterized protein n=1 Tax=Rhizophora mucronata TaxID=61149 RepID=A0A2P2NC43_RHIMU
MLFWHTHMFACDLEYEYKRSHYQLGRIQHPISFYL